MSHEPHVQHSVPIADLYTHVRDNCPCNPRIEERGYYVVFVHKKMTKPAKRKPPSK